jgi:3-(3-hydroxy-phenyl)propionate hydroxylase/6-hydroxy-3-succinoylpyridine 3-monooxygenase
MAVLDSVIVVGAGPIGLLTALGLARSGVRVTVVERGREIVASPRAITYHWSALDGIARLGLLEEAMQLGFAKQDYCFLDFQSGEQIGYSLEILEGRTPYPYNLHLGQNLLADIALRRLQRYPHAEVRWGTAVQGLTQDADGVTIHAQGPEDAIDLRAGWVVGADGATSAVRKAIGVEFDGMTWSKRFIAANLRYDFSKHGYARTTFLIDSTYGAIIVKLDKDDLWRCTYSESLELPEEGIAQRMPAFLNVILPGAQEVKVDAFAPYRMHQRAATNYRVGRVLLAGDAAHATNPSGAYGLTSGLFDVFVLYDALAAVIQGAADVSVLDRYAAERRRNFLEIVSPAAVANKRMIFDTTDPRERAADLERLRKLATDQDVLLDRLMLTARMRTEPLVAPRPHFLA